MILAVFAFQVEVTLYIEQKQLILISCGFGVYLILRKCVM